MSEQVRRKLKAAMQENARLRGEIERLREIWDALAAFLCVWHEAAKPEDASDE